MPLALRLSVLDQTPVSAGSTPADSLRNSLDLARHVDALGYTRIWYSEHHATNMLVCTAPEILIARAAAETTRIRVGSGGVMLSHYAPLKVAEVFRTLHALYPDRIDLGLGRAPGAGQLETYALRRNRETPQADDFIQQLAELRSFLHPIRWLRHQDAESDPEGKTMHPFSSLRVSPASPGAPDVWLLGSSMWSSVTASNEGLPYVFAHFFSGQHTRMAVEHYLRNFRPSGHVGDGRQSPQASIAVGVICAPTQQEADHLYASTRLLQERQQKGERVPIAAPDDAVAELADSRKKRVGFAALQLEPTEGEFPRYLVGTPDKVRDQLLHIARELNLDEIMVNTITHSHQARLGSYTLLAEAFGLAEVN